jgi:hypothetical protein
VGAGILHGRKRADAALQLAQDAPRGIRAAVIDHYNFVIDAMQLQLQRQMLYCSRNASCLIECGDYYRQ